MRLLLFLHFLHVLHNATNRNTFSPHYAWCLLYNLVLMCTLDSLVLTNLEICLFFDISANKKKAIIKKCLPKCKSVEIYIFFLLLCHIIYETF